MEQTFQVTITGTEYGEWQGHASAGSRESAEFQSVLELLKFIKKELGENQK